ncbi:hypothetical protein [Castellaniella sp.]|uniref:hypothetical protein n=1 Tax=Castellaniella sp. TaxID=1955812 RepID=UPI002AFF4BB8|nr:hypothetical protein [Castellaniella sp.]
MQHTGQSIFSSLTRHACRAGLVAALMVLAGCTVTGQGISSSGLNKIVEGRTTIAQASVDLGAQPTNIWQQGDTTLVRWAYLGSLAYDAVYTRQEVSLRFGPDGTFQRMEDSVNIPPMYRPRTAAEADKLAGGAPAPVSLNSTGVAPITPDQNLPAADGTITIPGNGPDAPGFNASSSSSGPAATPQPVVAPAAIDSRKNPQPLLPAGAQVVPGVTYPLPGKP